MTLGKYLWVKKTFLFYINLFYLYMYIWMREGGIEFLNLKGYRYKIVLSKFYKKWRFICFCFSVSFFLHLFSFVVSYSWDKGEAVWTPQEKCLNNWIFLFFDHFFEGRKSKKNFISFGLWTFWLSQQGLTEKDKQNYTYFPII